MAVTAKKALALMTEAHERGRLAHAFLVSGPAGSGKRDLAARVIQLVNPPPDDGAANLFGDDDREVAVKPLEELEGEFVRIVRPESKSRRIKVEQIRELEHAFQMAAPAGTWKIGVVLDADRMWDEPSNAFLKTLEEPPPGSLVLLLTAQPELLLPTIRSRCVDLVLQPVSRAEPLEGEEREAFGQLLDRSGRERSARGALLLRGGFEAILASRKAAIAARNEASLKEEAAAYKQTTEGDWLEKRAEYFKARTEAEYIGVRAGLMDWLIGWMGDAVRQKVGAAGLAYPESAAETAAFAASEELPGLLRRLDALQELREGLNTNVQEGLAMEIAFLRAFG
ncbi:MAG: hypothetical protein HKN82_10760 [Akkermansiaceae bacterium]|nr:hypothetical protein [Akkermansiaceae bacterium]NNM28891.1 hypothetical protein [Akkermansiaceae bacterium]